MDLLTQFAYLDAGTGSLIIQSLIGVVAAVGVFGRKYFWSLKSKITGKGTADKTTATSKADTSKK